MLSTLVSKLYSYCLTVPKVYCTGTNLSIVISSVVERSLHALRLVEMTIRGGEMTIRGVEMTGVNSSHSSTL